MTQRWRLHNFAIVDGGIEFDIDSDVPAELPDEPPPPPRVPELPDGFDDDRGVAFSMLLSAMNAHGLNPIGVQNHGQQIVAALRDTWPDLDVYLSPSDAPVWPGFGSIDVTIDSGKGGWQFRPDGVTPYRRDR